jgi:hypothetical protein
VLFKPYKKSVPIEIVRTIGLMRHQESFMFTKISVKFVFVVVLGLILTACGGSGGSNAPVALPTVGVSVSGVPIVADLGFRPEVNGFNFANYGQASDIKNLTPAEMRSIFGDKVCASTAKGECILAPAAEQWMTQQNQNMDGGHCFGFSVASLLLYQNKISPADFGGNSTIGLVLDGNDKLQRRIAESFVFQTFDPVRAGAIAGAPNDLLDKLIAVLRAGKDAPETYTLGIMKPDRSGGHAITPYAVEDRGNGIYAVMIYDNNYPNADRAILFDRKANTWNYTTTTNPNEPTSEYQGTASTKSMFLFPTTPGLKQQECTFCKDGAASARGKGLAAAELNTNEIYLDGDPSIHAHLLITDRDGLQYGYLPGGEFVTTSPNVQSEIIFGDLADDSPEPTYVLPVDQEFMLTIDGTPLEEPDLTDVVMIGPGYDLGVLDILLDPGQMDTLTLAADGEQLSYTTESTESPSLILGFEGENDDYEFEFAGVDVEGGGTINLALDLKEGFIVIDTDGTQVAGQYALRMTRIDDNGEQTYEHDDIQLEPTDTLYIYFANWSGEGGTLELGIDAGSTGTITEHITLTDEN